MVCPPVLSEDVDHYGMVWYHTYHHTIPQLPLGVKSTMRYYDSLSLLAYTTISLTTALIPIELLAWAR